MKLEGKFHWTYQFPYPNFNITTVKFTKLYFCIQSWQIW